MRCLAVFLLFAVSSFAQSFTKTDYAVGSNPRGIVSADFNRDGVADLAVANHDSGSVSILLGRGDGTFGSASAVTVADNPNEIITADFNGDGIADLAVAGSSVTILLGNGDGTFKRGDVGVSSSSITAADFNGDGKLDLAVVTGGKVQVLIGDGTGVFAPGAVLSGEVPFFVVRAADLNRDGKVDLAIGACCQGSDVTYGAVFSAIGNGDGTFTVSKITDESDGTRLTVADVTGDGATDLILPYQGCHTPCTGVEVMVNDGGSFTRFGGAGISTLDYGGPGQAAVGNFGGGTQIAVPFGPGDDLLNGGGSGLDKVLVFTIGSDGKSTAQGDYAVGSGYGPWGIVAGDFNHDGKMDLAVTDTRVGKITVLLNAQAPADFAMTVNFSPQTVKAGDKTQYQYVLEATNGTIQNLQLSCSGLPAGATCAFDTLQPGNITEGWVTIQTTARTSAALRANQVMFFAMMLPFGFVALPGDRRKRALWVALVLLAFAVALQTGCGGGGSNAMSSNSAAGGSSSGSSGSSANAGGSTSGGTSSGTTSGSNTGSTGSGSGSGSSTGSGSSGSGSSGSGSTGSGSGSGSGGSGGTGGGGGTTVTGTPAGTYQVTITAKAGDVTHTSNVTLVVQ